MKKIALQLYSLRVPAQEDFIGTIKTAAKLGFYGVEFAGYHDIPAKELRKVLDGEGLVGAGSHVGYQILTENLDQAIEDALTLGLDNFACPGAHPTADETHHDGWMRIADEFMKIGAKCKEAGLDFAYHNHSGEFQVVDGEMAHEILFDNTDPAYVKMQLDTCWVENAGIKAVDWMNKYAPALKLLHIKELTAVGDPTALPVGDGCVDFPPIVELGKKLGVKWYTIEHEDKTTDFAKLYADIEKGRRYLDSIL